MSKKRKRYITFEQDLYCIYRLEGGCQCATEDDVVMNYNINNGPLFSVVVPGLYEWYSQYEYATDFSETETDPDFDWAQWHREGLMFAMEIQRHLPRDFTLLYKHPFEDKSGLIDTVNMVTDDVLSIYESLQPGKGNKPGPVYVTPLECKVSSEEELIYLEFKVGKSETVVRFRSELYDIRNLRLWLESVVKGIDGRFRVLIMGKTIEVASLFFLGQTIGRHKDMGQFWIHDDERLSPVFSAYVNRRAFVKTVYLSVMSELGFFQYADGIDPGSMDPKEKTKEYWMKYNELRSDIIEWFITDELYFSSPMPGDRGCRQVRGTFVLYPELCDALLWNEEGVCCNDGVGILISEGKEILLDVPGLQEWADEYDSETIKDFKEYWDRGWNLALCLRTQLPRYIDLFYMCFDPLDPGKRMDYDCHFPKIIVPSVYPAGRIRYGEEKNEQTLLDLIPQ